MSKFSKASPQFLVTPSGGLGFEHQNKEVTVPTVNVDPVTGGIKELTVAGSTLASFVTLPGDEVAGVTAEV